MPELERLVDALFSRPDADGHSLGLVIQQGGSIVAERYGTQPANDFQPAVDFDADSTLISWSMAKSITHAAVGILVADGSTSNCIEMLFGDGGPSHAAYAAGQPLDHAPGTVWNYSSGTTNIISRIIGDIVSGGPGGDPGNREAEMRAFLLQRLFEPTGMATAEPKFDGVGDFVGSSYVYASARDSARFGELYRHDGVTDLGSGVQIVPPGWAGHAALQVAVDEESGCGYGRHWWSWPDVPGSYSCHGYEGQFIVVAPECDVVLVHLGKTDVSVAPALRARLGALLKQLS
jgi:CubicO group peptidase (beta-lactamase class C family)